VTKTASAAAQKPVADAGAKSSPRRTLLLVALAATAVVTPFFFFGNASGHDIQFHLSSWMDVAGQWREGAIYPRWAEWANWGFGEPRFIFYPPISWMLGAALGSALPWSATPGAYVWIALVVAGMSMWKLAREWLPAPQATLAAIFFAVNPYNLAMVYYRSDYAELLAAALLPLLVWAALHALREEWRYVPLLAAVFAAIWLCNAPEGVIATYAVGMLVILGCVLRRSARPLLPGGFAMAGGFALAAFYILPAARERAWVQILQALTTNLRPEQNFLFSRSSDPDFQLFNWKISSVALGMIVVAAIAAGFTARRRRELREPWWILVALSCASSVLMVRQSAVLWRDVPELSFVQFPWRWLGALAVAFGFLTAAAIGTLQAKWKTRLVSGLMIGALGITGALIGTSTWWNSDDASLLEAEIHSGHGYEGVDEYEPLGADRYSLPNATPDATEPPEVPATPVVTSLHADSVSLQPPKSNVDVRQWSAERKQFTAESSAETALAVRLLSYPAWEVKVDGKDVHTEVAPKNGEMLLPIEAGTHRVDIRFRETPDRELGDAVSIFSAILLAAFGWGARRQVSATSAGGA
jgi:hypothetical protein